ncbi:diaminopimelate decarboxylase [Candidatus Uabimicrobium amorphum]|uniref:Diaminopimelate decarboxylase n=1 Tax=Uabimicrobium amorphum TaxID=2596890 RepID=A0A5S9F5S8_UABAM|nr:diaminopimelate decarboxylase [Candidatus Uabimicrobium amorphum]BBM86433.1 diaminopimelate decarboxylase [Candidatus Uabimicrobium amorphum]
MVHKEIQGISLLELADKYDTPLYIYDTQVIKQRYFALHEALSPIPHKIKYACKALSNIHILRLLSDWKCGLDCVSPNEISLGIMANFSQEEIIFTPNSVAFNEIEEAYKQNVLINIDSTTTLEKFGKNYPKGKCSLRFNPDITAGANSSIQTGHRFSKFGIAKDQLDDVVKIVRKYSLEITGIHIHTGSGISQPHIFVQILNTLSALSTKFPHLQFVDIGGGFKVAYREGDAFISIEALAQQIVPAMQNLNSNYGKTLELWCEPGKYLVSDCGYLLVTVNQIKQNGERIFAGVNSGQNHLIRPMLYDAYHKITNLSNPHGDKRVYDIVGYICEEDTFARQRQVEEIHEGDVLCIHNAGAYGYSMSSNYNSRCRPAEVMIHEGKDILIRKRETLQDLLRGQNFTIQ